MKRIFLTLARMMKFIGNNLFFCRQEGWQNGNAPVSKTGARKGLQVRALYPPPGKKLRTISFNHFHHIIHFPVNRFFAFFLSSILIEVNTRLLIFLISSWQSLIRVTTSSHSIEKFQTHPLLFDIIQL